MSVYRLFFRDGSQAISPYIGEAKSIADCISNAALSVNELYAWEEVLLNRHVYDSLSEGTIRSINRKHEKWEIVRLKNTNIGRYGVGYIVDKNNQLIKRCICGDYVDNVGFVNINEL